MEIFHIFEKSSAADLLYVGKGKMVYIKRYLQTVHKSVKLK